MITTKVFKKGDSQAVRIPREFQFDVAEVEILKRGEEIILRKKSDNLADAFSIITSFSDDFMKHGRSDAQRQDCS